MTVGDSIPPVTDYEREAADVARNTLEAYYARRFAQLTADVETAQGEAIALGRQLAMLREQLDEEQRLSVRKHNELINCAMDLAVVKRERDEARAERDALLKAQHEHVEAVCTTCHHAREAQRRAAA
jgi:uncharacterized protein (DUF2132 family)